VWNAVRDAVVGRAEVGMETGRRADARDVVVRKRMDRQRGDVGVPDVVRREDRARNGRRLDAGVAREAIDAERAPLLEGVEAEAVGGRAELARAAVVLDLQHRLAGLDERQELVALLVAVALLVDLPVEVREQVRDLIEVVL